ncbi:Mitochondrial carrier protein ymc2 [Tilletia horrida]|nr:Mitochondrial carrier protein ymc2 [Tilletia horrida]
MVASAAESQRGGFRISRTTRDILSGTTGGIAQVLVGQPFDILKVRLQTAAPGTYAGMGDLAKKIIVNEGPLAFYKGTLTPLLGIGLCVSIQFGVVEHLKREFSNQNSAKTKGLNSALTLTQLYAAGAAAGIANSFVAGPIEHIRIRLQTQATKIYHGPLDCFSKITAQAGSMGIFRGMVPTLLREGVGTGSYFFVYENLVQWYLRRQGPGTTRADLPTVNAMAFGACAGIGFWLSAYPFEFVLDRNGLLVLRSTLSSQDWYASCIVSPYQTDSLQASSRQYRGSLDCAAQIWRTAGIQGFLKGLGPTLSRAPVAAAATFVAFEAAARNLDNYV